MYHEALANRLTQKSEWIFPLSNTTRELIIKTQHQHTWKNPGLVAECN